MQSDNLIKISIGVAVGVLLLVTLALPLISNATETDTTFTNDGLFRMTEYDATADFTAVWDYANPYVLTVGDEVIALPESSTYLMTVTGNDGFMVRMGVLSNAIGYGMQLYDSTATTAKISASESTENSMAITVSGGTITFNNGTDTYTETYADTMFFISSDGDYVMKSADSTAYVNGDSTFYGIGRTGILTAENTTTQTPLYIAGTVDDGFTVEGIYLTDITSDNHVINKATVNDHLDLYKLSGVTFTVHSTDYATDCAYSQIIVPYEVTAEKAAHFSDAEITMLELVPLLLAVALVLGVIAYAVRARLS